MSSIVKIAPSILSADFARLGDQVKEAEAAGADWLHVDVMDGRFVPNITLGPIIVEAVKRSSRLPLDVHLMIVEPEKYLEAFAKAGADRLIVHAEACPHLHRTLQQIRELGAKTGVAINPATPLSAVEEILPEIDQLLVMTVNPGFGGQKFIELCVDKVARAKKMIERSGAETAIEVDGGIDRSTAPKVVQAGASILVAGNAIFHHPNGIAAAIAELRASIQQFNEHH
jgi:ribulose-phosphate 3-epimerase